MRPPKLTEAIELYTRMVDTCKGDPNIPSVLFNIASLWNRKAMSMGSPFGLNETQREEWRIYLGHSNTACERLLTEFPTSPQVAMALQMLLDNQKKLVLVAAKKEDDTDTDPVTTYFQALAAKFAEKPDIQSKILFTLASHTYGKDKKKALEQMEAAYKTDVVYAPADIDLYGIALFDEGKIDQAVEVYQKLAADFPDPDPAHPEKSPSQVKQAQSVARFGEAKALRLKGEIAEAAEKFAEIKKIYNLPPDKVMEANYVIALHACENKKGDEATRKLLIDIIRAQKASTELRANAMLLRAKLLENVLENKDTLQDWITAMDEYIKIADYYSAIRPVAAEALWRGGQLLEKHAVQLPPPDPKIKNPLTKTGQLRKALRAYQDLVAKYPEQEQFVNEAKARIAELEPRLK